MASHLRRQIREGVATAVTALTTTGTRVFQSRVYDLQLTDLPGLKVDTLSETVDTREQELGFPSVKKRYLQVRVTAITRATADLDDTLDQICKEVEVALAMPCASLAGIAKTITLLSTEIELVDGAEQPRGQAAMLFEVFYMAADNAPDVAL